jgi:hypothetical protein
MQSVAEKEESNVMTIDPPPLVMNNAHKDVTVKRQERRRTRNRYQTKAKRWGIVLTQIVRHLCEDESSGSESKTTERDHVHGGTTSRSLSGAGTGTGSA